MDTKKTPYYIYDGKFWIKEPTGSDNNSFFHSVFGSRENKNEPFINTYVNEKRSDWSKLITSFVNETMPPPLAEILRRCLSVNDKYRNASLEDKDQFEKYVADIAAAEHPVTVEEIPILAAIDNLRIVILSKSGSNTLITIEPNLEILDHHRRDIARKFRKKREVVLSLEENVFSKLKIVDDELKKFYLLTYLTDYWAHHFKAEYVNVIKCEIYASALVNTMYSWMESCLHLKNHFVDVKLQMTMLADIFQENYLLDESLDWDGCKEYEQVDKSVPKLPEKMSLVKLFHMFIEKKGNVFVNSETSDEDYQKLMVRFEECIVSHQIFAIETALGKEKYALFSIQEQSSEDMEANLLTLGLVEQAHNEFHFVHKIYQAYFVAEVILKELQLQNNRAEFQRFFFEEILSCSGFNVIRAFIDSRLETTIDSISSDILRKYETLKCGVDFKETLLQSTFHLLAEEGCTSILHLLLKCFRFEVTRGKKIQFARVFHTSFDQDTWKHIFGNPLNVLRMLVRHGGVNIRDRDNTTPLHFAAKKGNLETAKFLVKQGADVNSLDRYNYTPLHFAALGGHVDTVKFLVESGAYVGITTKSRFIVDKDKNENHMALHLAAKEGHIDVVQILVEHGGDVDMKHDDGPTALYLAVLENKSDLTKYLVKKGADVNTKYNEGLTPLHLAASNGNLEIAKLLIEHGGDIHLTNDKKSTVLHLAISNSRLEIVQFLLECGANVHTSNCHNCAPIVSAVFNNDKIEFVKCLLEKGANINTTDEEGCTPVYLAFRHGNMNTAKFLLDNGADINVTNDEDFALLHFAVHINDFDRVKFLVERGADVNVKSGDGPTALHLAVTEGNIDVVKFLVQHGADGNIRDKEGRTPLHIAVDKNKLDMVKVLTTCSGINVRNHLGETALFLAACWNYFDIVQVLVQHGADVNIPNNYNRTPLYSAISDNSLNVVKLLLEQGAHADFSGTKGCKTALHFAALRCSLDTLKFFLDRDPNFDIKGGDGATLFLLAVKGYYPDVVKFLLECGADLGSTDDRGRTALHLAAKKRRGDVVDFLVEAGMDVTARDKDGRTPFHWAAMKGALGIVEFLIERVGDINIIDGDGRTALHLAAFKDCLRVVEFLVEAGVDRNIVDRDGCTALHLATLWCPFSDKLMKCLESNSRGRKRRLSLSD